MMMSGAAPLAKTDVDRFYEKYNIDPQVFKFHQGGCSQNRVIVDAKFSTCERNEMFIEFRGSNFRGRISTCASFEGSDIFFSGGDRNVEEEERRVLHLWVLRARTNGVHMQFLTRSDESATSILE